MIVVADAGPLIHLSWLGHLNLLEQQFEEVFVPPAVRDEVVLVPQDTLGLDDIQRSFARGWLVVRTLTRPAAPQGMTLGAGELEALALAEELGAALFLTDDGAARREGLRRGFQVTGTLGVLAGARSQGLIPAILPFALELKRLGQWLSDELLDTIRSEDP